jgi:TLC domain
MFGNGDFANHFIDYPFIEHPPYYMFFYMTCTAYHMVQLFESLTFEMRKRNDFIEMFLHHLVTAYLLIFSYLSNFFIGAIVLLIHNSSDIFISWTRAWSETTYKVTDYSFIPMIVAWIYTRLFCFGELLWKTFYILEYFMVSPWVPPAFLLMLGSLYLLHVYWTYLLVKVVHRKLTQGVIEDYVQKP